MKGKEKRNKHREKQNEASTLWRTKELRQRFLCTSPCFPSCGLIIRPSLFPRVVGPLCMALGKWLVLPNIHVTIFFFFWATRLLFPAFLAIGVDVWMNFSPWNVRSDVQKWMNTHTLTHTCTRRALSLFFNCMRRPRSGGKWSHVTWEAELRCHHPRPIWTMMGVRNRFLFCSTTLVSILSTWNTFISAWTFSCPESFLLQLTSPFSQPLL